MKLSGKSRHSFDFSEKSKVLLYFDIAKRAREHSYMTSDFWVGR